MNTMLRCALELARIPQIALAEAAFAAGLPENEISNPEDLIFDVGYCYRGFREFPPYLMKFDISKNKKILLVRDPRDMIVSSYFSMKFSHGLPRSGVVREMLLREREAAREMDLDQYCLSQVGAYRAEFAGYAGVLRSEVRVFRYEDVIFSKVAWLREMLDYLEIDVPPETVRRIAIDNDVRPDGERPHQHIRQVNPGNFRKHLRDETIERLNGSFSDILARHGYQ